MVRDSMKYMPLGRAPSTDSITRRSAVAREPMWLFTPRAYGTACSPAAVVRAISTSDIDVSTAPLPGDTRGNCSGSMGR